MVESGFLFGLVAFDHLEVDAFLAEQLVGWTILGQFSLVQHQDLVVAVERGQSMRNRQNRLRPEAAGDDLLDQRVIPSVDVGGRLVDQDDLRVFQEGSADA